MSDRLDNQSPELFGPTPEQTIGPFFHYGLPWKGGADLVGRSELGARPELVPQEHWLLDSPPRRAHCPGEPIEIFGRVLDGQGDAVTDALIEIWQADGEGRYGAGFGRAATAEDGGYCFLTVKPARVAAPGGGLQGPHLAVSVFARGLLKRLVTRIYFADGEGNADDPVLARVPAERRGTLIAELEGGRWHFDIVLQGERETAFFAL